MSGYDFIPHKLPDKRFHFDHICADNPQVHQSLLLYQIGDLACDSGMEVGGHIQHCYEISYIVSGKGYFSYDGIEYKVEQGDIFLCLKGRPHNLFADSIDPFRYFYVGFDFISGMDKDNPMLHIKQMFDQVESPLSRDRFGIGDLFKLAFSEIAAPKEFSSFMVNALLNQMVVIAYRSFFNAASREQWIYNELEQQNSLAYRVINFIDANLLHITCLNDIAACIGYNYSYLSHMFSTQMGYTINEYYSRERFKRAAKWLSQTDYSITHISEMLRFKSIHIFSKAFRRHMGVSPSEYRMSHAGD